MTTEFPRLALDALVLMLHAIVRLYRKNPFAADLERLEPLFERYRKLVES